MRYVMVPADEYLTRWLLLRVQCPKDPEEVPLVDLVAEGSRDQCRSVLKRYLS